MNYENLDLILRRPPKGTKAKSAHDMVREYTVQKNLAPYYPVVPQMVALCEDESVIGCDFYVMKRIEELFHVPNCRQSFSWVKHKYMSYVLMSLISSLNYIKYLIRGTELEKLGKGEGYCRRQVEGWDKRYEKARTINVPSF